MNKSPSSSLIYDEMDSFEKCSSEYPFEVIWIYPKKGFEISLSWPNLITSHLIHRALT